MQYVKLNDVFTLIIRLIVADLKIHGHLFWLSDNNIYSPPLELQLHQSIFSLMGFEKNQIDKELEEWYFKQLEQMLREENVTDQNIILEKTNEIVKSLNLKRIEIQKRK